MMEKTWRWFGKKDKITLPMLRQIGVEGIVTALHDVPNGEIWTVEAINDLKSYIESYGLRWSVVESLPVCEAIKYAGAEREQLIENYKVSLANLGKCGIKTCPLSTGYVQTCNIPGRTEPVHFITTVFALLISISESWNVKELKKITLKKNFRKLPSWIRLSQKQKKTL